jgi:hypothetical protein
MAPLSLSSVPKQPVIRQCPSTVVLVLHIPHIPLLLLLPAPSGEHTIYLAPNLEFTFGPAPNTESNPLFVMAYLYVRQTAWSYSKPALSKRETVTHLPHDPQVKSQPRPSLPCPGEGHLCLPSVMGS